MRIDFYGAGGLSASPAHCPVPSPPRTLREPGMGARAPADPVVMPGAGTGNKCRPCIQILPGESRCWLILPVPAPYRAFDDRHRHRDMILRIYWEDSSSLCGSAYGSFSPPLCQPPLPDNGPACLFRSIPVCVNPNRALSCFWEMPFRRRRVNMTNLHPRRRVPLTKSRIPLRSAV